jgi:hypothetical protein
MMTSSSSGVFNTVSRAVVARPVASMVALLGVVPVLGVLGVLLTRVLVLLEVVWFVAQSGSSSFSHC